MNTPSKKLPIIITGKKEETHILVHEFKDFNHPEYDHLALGVSYIQIEKRTLIISISLLSAKENGDPNPHQVRVPIHFIGVPQVRIAEMEDGSIRLTAISSNIREKLLQFALVTIDSDGTIHINEGKEYTMAPSCIMENRGTSLPKLIAKRHEKEVP